METFHLFMQGAATAMEEQGAPFIDEPLSMAIDSAFLYMVHYDAAGAREAGALRLADPYRFSLTYPKAIT